MKKLLTLMIMLGVFLIPRYTTHAYSLDANDIPISQLNNLTLNEVFIDNNLITNPNFNNGTTGYVSLDSSSSVVNNILSNTGNGVTVLPRIEFLTNSNYAINDIYYVNLRARVTNSLAQGLVIGIQSVGMSSRIATLNNPIQNIYYNLSNVFQLISGGTTNATLTVRHSYTSTANANGSVMEIDGNYGVYVLNITTLGFTANNKNELDYWFNEFKQNKAFIEGYNQGELDGYANGLQDNTAYVQGYNVGYTDGLLGGSDMETGSSILIFVVGAIGFIMMIFGFTTKRRIFNLLSVGAFIVLGGLLAQYVGFIIITIGLVFINVYYTFWGDL